MKKQKTAVEFILNEMIRINLLKFSQKIDDITMTKLYEEMVIKSEKIFEEQIIEAYRTGRTDQANRKQSYGTYNRIAEGYYQYTYGGDQ